MSSVVEPSVAPRLGEFDEVLHDAGFRLVAGCDEAGRGSLAGPLVAAACILPPGWVPDGLTDSKLMTPMQRERMFDLIVDNAVAWSVRRVSSDRVDRVGLQRANIRALRESVAKLDVAPDYVAVDGFALPRLGAPSLRMIKGDYLCAAIAAASVLAKVSRDRSMVRMHKVNVAWRPYRFDLNKGYRSPVHLEALREIGPCDEHRRCFREVRQAEWPQLDLTWDDDEGTLTDDDESTPDATDPSAT